MIDIIINLFLVSTTGYILVLILIGIGLIRLKVINSESGEFISIVIAARNEAHRILPTLKSLEKLDYPRNQYEVIFVDDASTDQTSNIIESYAQKHHNWHLMRFNKKSRTLKGKKRALSEAIKLAKGEIILTTDADCIVPPRWLKIMGSYFERNTSMVLGHSPILKKRGVWGKILEFDNLFSAILGSAPTKLGYPLTSVGRNLGYRKSVYEQVGGFNALKKFRSGDDVHLTERFRGKGRGKIEYCAHPDTFVLTSLPSTNWEIFHQQIRKNSKVLNKSLPSVLFSIVIFLIFLTFISLPLLDPASFELWLRVIVVKQLFEFAILAYATSIFKKKNLIPFIPLFQLIYPIYIIFFSTLGILQIYEWKK